MAPSITGRIDHMGRNPLPMLESPIVIVCIASILGFLAGIGVGGGSLLILWLTVIMDVEHPVARTMNLLFFIPSALIATIYRWKKGSLEWRKVLPAILAGCLSAACFSLISTKIDTNIIKRIFGGLLLFAGAKEVFYRERKAK